MVENHISTNVDVDQGKVNMLMDFGFDRNRSVLALKITSNNVD